MECEDIYGSKSMERSGGIFPSVALRENRHLNGCPQQVRHESWSLEAHEAVYNVIVYQKRKIRAQLLLAPKQKMLRLRPSRITPRQSVGMRVDPRYEKQPTHEPCAAPRTSSSPLNFPFHSSLVSFSPSFLQHMCSRFCAIEHVFGNMYRCASTGSMHVCDYNCT